MDIQVTKILTPRDEMSLALPLFVCRVAAGFPSPAEDWLEDTLDLNELLIKNPPATFLLRVSGNSMEGAGINSGAILVVDRSITPKPGMIVVAVMEGGLTVKRYVIGIDGPCLHPENKDFHDIPITEETTVWGVVKSAITQF